MPSRSAPRASVVRRAAFLAASAVLGTLAGFGVAGGQPLAVLGGAGLRLRGLPEFVTPDRGVGPTAILGSLHAGLVSYGWGLLAAWLALHLSGWRAAAALLTLAVAIFALDPLLPAVARLAAGAPSPGQRALCVVLLAVGAAVGSRLVPADRTALHPAPADRQPDAAIAVAPAPERPPAA